MPHLSTQHLLPGPPIYTIYTPHFHPTPPETPLQSLIYLPPVSIYASTKDNLPQRLIFNKPGIKYYTE
jgi:hypothetical protein